MKQFIIFCSLLALTLSINSSSPSSLDTSFNGSGILNLLPSSLSQSQTIQSLAIQTDGKIIFAGYTTTTAQFGILGRLNTNGSLDTTFNAAGTTPGYVIITNGSATSSALFDVKIQTDGKIIAAGTIITGGINYGFLTRYTNAGILDTTTFNTAGTPGFIAVYPSTYPAQGAQFYGIAVQANGAILTAGTTFITSTNSLPMITRFTSNGTLDTTFNSSGTVAGYSILPQISTNIYGAYFDIALQTNQSIVVTGYVGTVYQSPLNYDYINPNGQMIVARYRNGSTNSGTLDPTLNPNGTPGYTLPILGSISAGYGLALQDDQKIIVGGWSNLTTTNPIYTVIRLTTIGAFDTSFNTTGINQSAFNGNTSSCQSVILQQDQQILTAGMQKSSSIYNLFAIRYDQDGTIDPTFNFSTNQSTATLQARSIAIAPDKKIMTGGVNLTSTNFNLLFYAFLGGQTPLSGENSTINNYGYNAAFLSEFLYINFYAQVITDTTAQSAAIAATNSVITSYINSYSNQSGFNYISYLYLMNPDFVEAQATLIDTYPNSSDQITQFFIYIVEREYQLLLQ